MSGGICWVATLDFFVAQAIARALPDPAGMAGRAPDPLVHSVGSLGIIFANIAVILLGSAISGTNDRWIKRLSVSLGVLGLTGEVFFFAHRALGGAGAAERVADYPVFAWMIVLGVCCARWSRLSGSPADRPADQAGASIP